MAELPRLREALGPERSASSEAVGELRFSAHPRGLVLIEGSIAGHLQMQCQRCLGPVTITLDESFRLAVHTGVSTPAVPDDFELLANGDEGLVPVEILEEELLLAVPLVAMHKDLSECGPLAERYSREAPAPERARPFAALGELRKAESDFD